MLWNWIAQRVENSILTGVERAIAKLEGNAHDNEGHEDAVASLHLRILAAPKAKPDEDATGTKRKAKNAA